MTTTFNLADTALIPVKIATPSHTRTSLDLTRHAGFKQGEGCYTFTVIDITFQLRHRFGIGWLAESKVLDEAEIFPTDTKPGKIAQRLEDIVCDFASAQGEAADPLDADWLTECLPGAEATPERYGLEGEV